MTRNKKWYDQQTKKLNLLISELRSLDPFKSLIDQNLINLSLEHQNMLWFGQSALHIEETKHGLKYTSIHPANFILN